MTRRFFAAIAIASLALAGPAGAVTIFTATIEQAQEVPPSGSAATGTGTFTLNNAQNELAYDILITGLDFNLTHTPVNLNDDITGMHIHVGAPGVNGGIVFGMHGPQHDNDDRVVTFPNAGEVRFQGIWDAADTPPANALGGHLGDLQSGNLYLNVHTTAFPNGEIRGQIVPEPSTALLLGLALAGLAGRRRAGRGA